MAAALKNPRRTVLRIVGTANAKGRFEVESAGSKYAPLEVVTAQEMARQLPADAVHQGIAAHVACLPPLSLDEVLQSSAGKPRSLIVALDQVTDPHNVGAILRSAAAFDVDAVITLENRSSPETAILAKAASGALEVVPMVAVTNLSQAMEECKKHGYWCVGLAGEAADTFKTLSLPEKLVLILGAEGDGMRRLTRERCDFLARLPISSAMESLNVSNAAAIAMYALSQRG